MLTLDINDIRSEGNVRVETGDVSTLAESIDRLGLLQPILVTIDDEGDQGEGRYVLLAGHRRLAAITELGWKQVEAVVDHGAANATDVLAIQYAENTQRVDLTDWEKAQVAWDLKLEGLKQAEVATAMGIPKPDVSKLHKIAKALLQDEALDGLTASRFDFDGLLQLAESPIPEHSMDVMLKIVSGEDRHVFQAVRSIEAELKSVEFYEQNADEMADWSKRGIQITAGDPRKAWGKTTSYGPKDDPKVILVADLGITIAKHIDQGCHMVWLDEKSHGGPVFRHYCMNKKNHADKGPSDVKAKDQDVVKSNAPDPKASAERAATKEAKDLRRAKAAKWMSSRYTKADMYEMALFMALVSDGWKEEHIRAATWMLELNSERPKGADYGWYSKRLDTWLDDRFGEGDDYDKRMEWKIRMMHARRYIDDFWPTDMVKEQIEAQEVTDGIK